MDPHVYCETILQELNVKRFTAIVGQDEQKRLIEVCYEAGQFFWRHGGVDLPPSALAKEVMAAKLAGFGEAYRKAKGKKGKS